MNPTLFDGLFGWSPNDPNIGQRRRRAARWLHGRQAVGNDGQVPGWLAAAGVTPAAVRCSAWLRDVRIDASITDADDEADNCEHGVKQGRLLTDE